VNQPLTIVGPGGSLARASRSLAALHVALDGAAEAGAVPYVVPVASAFRVFDSEGRVKDEGVELQLRTLGAEVVRVATRFADHVTPQRARECEESAERVAAAAVSTATRP
jgi:hypothetical protein